MNKLYCTARLTRDIEIKEAMTGTQVATIGLAIDNGMANGEKNTLFLSAKAFGKTAENCAKFLSKGSLISCDIKISNNDYTDKEGNKKYGHEFVIEQVNFLSTKPKEEVETYTGDQIDAVFNKITSNDNLLD